MVLKGGTLKFISQNQDEIEQKLKDILEDYGTTIEVVVHNITNKYAVSFVIKITVDIKFKYVFEESGPLYINAQLPTVIILKLFVYNEKGTAFVDNEVTTQKDIDTLQIERRTQICPSVLYVKDIDGKKQKGTLDWELFELLHKCIVTTKSGNRLSIYQILQCRFPTGGVHILKKKAFFMEFLSCKSLNEFCEIPENFAEGKLATSIDSVQLDIATNPTLVLGLDKDSFKKMALHYITLKLFSLNCIHGDLHASNVYILIDGTNIIILIIDLGNGKIDSLQLKFDAGISDTIDETEFSDILKFNLKRNFCIIGKTPDLHAERLTQLCLKLKQKEDIKTIIDTEIAEMRYFDAAVMINMCVEITGHYHSTFIPYLSKNKDIYMPLYCCYKDPETETTCNTIIEKGLFSNQGTKRQKSDKYVPAIEGGFSFYKNRSNKFITSKQINRKSKKRKNKTRNTKKSRKITMKKRRNRTKK